MKAPLHPISHHKWLYVRELSRIIVQSDTYDKMNTPKKHLRVEAPLHPTIQFAFETIIGIFFETENKTNETSFFKKGLSP